MKNSVWAKTKTVILFLGLIFVFAQIFSVEAHAQKRRKTPPRTARKKLAPKPKPPTVNPNLPKVTQIDAAALKNLLKREGENAKPLLINFWATWCEPCREEFPELVKINADYKGKIDFITISLDYLSEINREVPEFLAEMKAEMPAYLLKTANEDEAIAMISKNYQGGLPLTILFDGSGTEAYFRMGIITPGVVRAAIDKLLAPVQENKADAKTKTKTEETKGFNRKPLDDFRSKFGEAILKNEININAPFSVEVNAKLDENGRLIEPVITAKSGDEKLIELAKEGILAFGDSQMLRALYGFGSRQVKITLAQDENNLRAIVQSETESEKTAIIIASALSFALKVSKPKEGSDEAILLSKTQIGSEGKSLTINFSISHDEKSRLIEKNLKGLREKSKNN